MKPLDSFDSAPSTFELLEMPATASIYRALYDELDGETITLDLDDDEL